MKMMMSVENWWNDDRQGKAEVLGENSASEPLCLTWNRARHVRRTVEQRMRRQKGMLIGTLFLRNEELHVNAILHVTLLYGRQHNKHQINKQILLY
jgi:hypothetical protein